MQVEIRPDELFLLIDKSIYNEDVLHKCFYWYGSTFRVEINDHSEKQYSVSLRPIGESENLETILEKIKRDLIDFKLRDIVTKETKTIRELIVAKAFAYYGLEDNPTTDISDPVGFNPESVSAND